MNKHFTKDHLIIVDTVTHVKTGKPWMGIIPHTGFAVTSITLLDGTQLTGADATNYVKDIAVGVPFLCQVTQIQLSAGGCKMINPN